METLFENKLIYLPLHFNTEIVASHTKNPFFVDNCACENRCTFIHITVSLCNQCVNWQDAKTFNSFWEWGNFILGEKSTLK